VPATVPASILKSQTQLQVDESYTKPVENEQYSIEQQIIPSTHAVVGTKQLSEKNEKYYFDGITGGLRKLRNRALKIDVLINDLLDCESQGFAVNSVFDPLKYQQEELKRFEYVVFDELQKIIDLCEAKASDVNGK